MQVIPVIDLMGGWVVRAKGGARETYRPIVTPLSATAAPEDVVAGLLRLAPFSALYIADLDAIMGKGDNGAALARLKAAFPALELWIDNGAATAEAVAAARAFGAPVLGSESQRDLALVASEREALLSLDFRGEAFQGPQGLLERAELWPERVIAMTLARVGAGAGPDLARLAGLRPRARRLYAAGGVRGPEDLAALRALGVAGVLVASALHDGALSEGDFC